MVAPTLIAAAYNMPGTPEQWKELPPASAALLIEFRADDPEELGAFEAAAQEILAGRPVLDGAAGSDSPASPSRSRCCGGSARGCRACWRRCGPPA